jgi:hypothetical protein
MATSTKVKLTNSFSDDSKATVEFSNLDSDTVVIETLRTNIKNFDASAISDTYVSETGSPFAKISGAVVTTVDEEEINLNVDEG